MATNNWNQIRLMSAKYDEEQLEYFRWKNLAEKTEVELETLAGAALELRRINRQISREMFRVQLYQQNNFRAYTRPMRGLRLIRHAVRRCLRAIAGRKRAERRSLRVCRRVAMECRFLADQSFENLGELAATYDGEILFKLTTTDDIGALRNVRDAIPNKVLLFSVGYSVTGQILDTMRSSVRMLGLRGLGTLRTSALYEMRGGRFRMLTEPEARRHGFGFRGVYGRGR